MSRREDNFRLVRALESIVGRAFVLTGEKATRGYRTGFRTGAGSALAVVRPRTLVELWRVLKCCIGEGAAVIMQAANTGLTGGSTPAGDEYGRDVVIISTLRITGIHVIDEGRQVICLPGTTLYQLEEKLKPWGREPHSVIGSSCIGASVMGGICNNSGGALVRRGPAFTQMALYARVDEGQRVQLVNHLGIALGEEPEEILTRLERGEFQPSDVRFDSDCWGSDHDYCHRVRDIETSKPARFNADPTRLFEASGCAGKLSIFAVRLDTFPSDDNVRVFYLGSNNPDELSAIRRHILKSFKNLPVAGEYIHRTAFDIAEVYGKDTYLAIRHLGTSRLPILFKAKIVFNSFVQGLGIRVPAVTDRILQAFSRLLPSHLPARMRSFRDRFEHHLIIKMEGEGIPEASTYFKALFPSATGDCFECTAEEARAAFLHRFAVAGAAVRYRAIHAQEVEDVVALDIALRPNDREWVEALPEAIASGILHRLYYGHFFCHVFHQDYIVRKGGDPVALEHAMWRLLDARGAEYPAEHNVGHLYRAKPALANFYRQLDPANCLNPGIGQTSKRAMWRA